MNRYIGILPVFSLVLLGGCQVEVGRSGPAQHETRSIPKDNSERVRVEVKMGGGELRMNGGAQDLLQADFTYSVPSWKPDVRYSSFNGRGTLRIEQPETANLNLGSNKYNWDLRLNETVPLDLSVRLGAGEATLNLGRLTLHGLEVEMGAGEIKMDLRGNPQHDYDARIRGGVGEATIYLPSNVGISAKATGGIGGIQTRGLRKDGDRWINDAYDRSKVQIHLDVSGGVGSINLYAE